MKILNYFRKKKIRGSIVTNSGNFIKSLDLSGKPSHEFIGYIYYLNLLDGIDIVNLSYSKTNEYIKDAF